MSGSLPLCRVNPGDQVPAVAYRPPQDLQVQVWTGLPAPDLTRHPKAQEILDQYLKFARFPLLLRVQPREDGQLLEWLDLRFSVPGRAFPFVLRLYLDAQGRMRKWLIDRGGQKVLSRWGGRPWPPRVGWRAPHPEHFLNAWYVGCVLRTNRLRPYLRKEIY